MSELFAVILSRMNYGMVIVLMMIGLYAMIVKKNLVKKIIGMNILQTSVILFFISIGAKKNATLPIITHGHDTHQAVISQANYINPLPHVLMLTAIVVAVATLGVALALVVRLYDRYQSLDEDDIRSQLEGNGRETGNDP